MPAKNHYLYFAKKAATFSLLATFMLPGNTFATTTPVRASKTFCSNLEAYVGKLNRRFGEKENQFETKKLEQSKKLAEREANRDK